MSSHGGGGIDALDACLHPTLRQWATSQLACRRFFQVFAVETHNLRKQFPPSCVVRVAASTGGPDESPGSHIQASARRYQMYARQGSGLSSPGEPLLPQIRAGLPQPFAAFGPAAHPQGEPGTPRRLTGVVGAKSTSSFDALVAPAFAFLGTAADPGDEEEEWQEESDGPSGGEASPGGRIQRWAAIAPRPLEVASSTSLATLATPTSWSTSSATVETSLTSSATALTTSASSTGAGRTVSWQAPPPADAAEGVVGMINDAGFSRSCTPLFGGFIGGDKKSGHGLSAIYGGVGDDGLDSADEGPRHEASASCS